MLDTYNNAIATGDKNVYFVDGHKIYEKIGIDLCMVDTAHPNDIGFWCMAEAIGPVVGKALGEK